MELNSDIRALFPELTEIQWNKLLHLAEIFPNMNEKVNLISRKEHDKIFERHILHSLALWKDAPFPDGIKVVDIGTGGGFPALPLAIVSPEVQFFALDSIGKKIEAVKYFVDELQLNNVLPQCLRAEQFKGEADAAITRAVAPLAELWKWSSAWLKKTQGKMFPWQGIRALKGGDLTEEIKVAQAAFPALIFRERNISDFYASDFFATKKIIQLGFSYQKRKS